MDLTLALIERRRLFYSVFLILICRVGLLMEFCSCMTLENIFLFFEEGESIHVQCIMVYTNRKVSFVRYYNQVVWKAESCDEVTARKLSLP